MRAWFSAADVWGIGEALMRRAVESRACSPAGRRHRARCAKRAWSSRRTPSRSGSTKWSELLLAEGVAGKRIAVQRHGDESIETVQALVDAGGEVVEVPVYEWTPARRSSEPAHRLIEATIAGSVHAVTFTSAPAIRNFFLIAEEFDVVGPLRAMLDGPVVTMCVGPVCASAARRCGLHHVEMPAKFRLGPMVRDLSTLLWLRRVRHFSFGGHAVVFRGSVVEVDRERIELDRS